MIKVMIDPGHGGQDRANRGPTGYIEADGVLDISKRLKDKLLSTNAFEVRMTRDTDTTVGVRERGEMAAAWKADLLISEHTNAINGKVRGVEVFESVDLDDDAFADEMSAAIANALGIPNRGGKEWESTNYPGEDYLGVIDAAQDGGVKHVLLVESAFHDNSEDEAILKQSAKRELIAEVQAKVICKKFGVQYPPVTGTTPIINKPTATVGQAKEWAKDKDATALFINLADIFWNLAPAAGVDPVVAYCQSAKETGFGRFGGVLDESFRNPCGMKKKEGGNDSDKNAHQRFNSWEEGIQAQIDHLALYAGASGYPKANTPDPRHFDFIRGNAKTVEVLGGKWAPSSSYGTDIVKMMEGLKATKEPVPEHWAEKHYHFLTKEKGIVINEKRFDDKITRGEVFALMARVMGYKE